MKVMVTRILCTLQLFSEVGVISESKGLHRKLLWKWEGVEVIDGTIPWARGQNTQGNAVLDSVVRARLSGKGCLNTDLGEGRG